MTQPTLAARQRSAGHPVAGAFLAVFGGLLWLIPVVVLVLIVPRFVEIFEKFDVAGGLPTATQAVITVAQALSTWWPVAVLLWLAVVGGLVALCAAVRARRPVALAAVFAGLSFLGVVITITLMVVVLFMPLVRLIEQTGRG